jgi:hypothetical protein
VPIVGNYGERALEDLPVGENCQLHFGVNEGFISRADNWVGFHDGFDWTVYF